MLRPTLNNAPPEYKSWSVIDRPMYWWYDGMKSPFPHETGTSHKLTCMAHLRECISVAATWDWGTTISRPLVSVVLPFPWNISLWLQPRHHNRLLWQQSVTNTTVGNTLNQTYEMFSRTHILICSHHGHVATGYILTDNRFAKNHLLVLRQVSDIFPVNSAIITCVWASDT
jgi:hypothetical protein